MYNLLSCLQPLKEVGSLLSYSAVKEDMSLLWDPFSVEVRMRRWEWETYWGLESEKPRAPPGPWGSLSQITDLSLEQEVEERNEKISRAGVNLKPESSVRQVAHRD